MKKDLHDSETSQTSGEDEEIVNPWSGSSMNDSNGKHDPLAWLLVLSPFIIGGLLLVTNN